MKKLIQVISCCLVLTACSNQSLSPQEYYNWLEEESNGLFKEAYIGGLHLKVKYIPAQYLAYKDMVSMELVSNQKTFDSLFQFYKNAHTFILNVSLDDQKNKNGDIMIAGASSKQEFEVRVHEMNFNLEEYISLECQEMEIAPVLTSFENVYGVKTGRSVYVVFSNENQCIQNAEDVVFTFNDQIFNTGKNKFGFKQNDLASIPGIKI